jgi:hypothetical protein
MMPIVTYASVQSSSLGKNITKSANQIFGKHTLTASQKSLGEIRLEFSFFSLTTSILVAQADSDKSLGMRGNHNADHSSSVNFEGKTQNNLNYPISHDGGNCYEEESTRNKPLLESYKMAQRNLIFPTHSAIPNSHFFIHSWATSRLLQRVIFIFTDRENFCMSGGTAVRALQTISPNSRMLMTSCRGGNPPHRQQILSLRQSPLFVRQSRAN